MQATPSLKFRIGLIFFILLAVFAIGITFFIKEKEKENTGVFQIFTVYKNAYGLQAGYKVRYNGIVVGQIDALSLLKDSAVQVNMSIDTAYRRYMRRDVVASVGSDGLMGDNLVDITPGSPQTAIIKPGDEIVGRQPVDYSRILKRVQHLGGRLSSLGPEIQEITEKFSKGKGSVAILMNDQKLKSQLKSTVKTARKTIRTVKKSTKG